MVKNTAGQEIPNYFIPCRGTFMDYYRQVANPKRWRNYLVTTYIDKYEAYINTFKFRAALKERIPFDYQAELRQHLIKKSNMQFVNHGRDGLVESYFLQDHHTLLHILVSKRVDTLTLMYQNLKFNEEIDEYLTIKRTFYYE